MSRSYKKNPIVKDCPNSSHTNKKIASRITRRRLNRGEEVASHRGYCKIFNPWLIHDYITRFSEDDARRLYRDATEYARLHDYDDPVLRRFPTEDEYIEKNWKKYLRK